jgi:hypothetical protein
MTPQKKKNGWWHLTFLLLVILYLYFAVHVISYFELTSKNITYKNNAIERVVLFNVLIPILMTSLYLSSTCVHPSVPKVWPWIIDSEHEKGEVDGCIEVKKDGSRRYCR